MSNAEVTQANSESGLRGDRETQGSTAPTSSVTSSLITDSSIPFEEQCTALPLTARGFPEPSTYVKISVLPSSRCRSVVTTESMTSYRSALGVAVTPRPQSIRTESRSPPISRGRNRGLPNWRPCGSESVTGMSSVSYTVGRIRQTSIIGALTKRVFTPGWLKISTSNVGCVIRVRVSGAGTSGFCDDAQAAVARVAQPSARRFTARKRPRTREPMQCANGHLGRLGQLLGGIAISHWATDPVRKNLVLADPVFALLQRGDPWALASLSLGTSLGNDDRRGARW